MKKIAFILYSLEGGGVERLTLHLMEGLLEKGYQVDLVVVQMKGEYMNDIPDGIRVIHLDKPNLRASCLAIRQYLSKHKPDVLISAKDYINLIVLLAKKLTRVPTKIIVSSHVNITEQARRLPQFNKVKRGISIMYRFADDIVCVSKGVADDIHQVSGVSDKKIHVIYNPIVTTELLKNGENVVEHPWFDQNQEVIVTVGRLHVQKDYKTLLHAFKKVNEVRPNTRLMIVGDGPEKDTLTKLTAELNLKEVVDFVGFQTNPYPYMKKADLFVLSSAWEGFGNVLIEAFAMGTTVVATDCPSGPAEILEHGRLGKLVGVGAVEEMADAILYSLDHPQPESALKQRASTFSIDNCVRAYEQLF
ncbi:glycosyltransferase [Alkalicoccobacillus murimartini]|uniref:Glycosyltransferase involved in cell wall biosynthesis n=1 Tax=Alkalicoccobacillus murimartini TaxID=171685 RepID=A0ABT9YGG9_9BACI|nr:glycosyltransferase [Alkalicoccobacillus murimartini]MDQ0206799.1 glycosyltransferase involved in cell wall biosynthesis [Alkalicoccobacillus murimartini]